MPTVNLRPSIWNEVEYPYPFKSAPVIKLGTNEGIENNISAYIKILEKIHLIA